MPIKCYNIHVIPRKLKRLKMAEYNRRRRAKRRVLREAREDEELALFKEPPTFQELKNALAEATENHLTIIRLAALMNNLSIYHSFRVTSSRTQHFGHLDDCRGRTIGIRDFLSKDGYLSSRYDCLMRYKRLGDALREAAEVDSSVNLLWGLSETCPTDDGEPIFEDDWRFLRNFYASFEGMNFKQIMERLKAS